MHRTQPSLPLPLPLLALALASALAFAQAQNIGECVKRKTKTRKKFCERCQNDQRIPCTRGHMCSLGIRLGNIQNHCTWKYNGYGSTFVQRISLVQYSWKRIYHALPKMFFKNYQRIIIDFWLDFVFVSIRTFKAVNLESFGKTPSAIALTCGNFWEA